MHPTAALLALHGCQFYQIGSSREFFGATRAVAFKEPTLIYDAKKGDWVTNTVGMVQLYRPCDWTAVPDRKWDVIRPDLLHRFIESITA
ncbi:hypothetical protein [Burkholderia sp. BE12]|uniref:hypothetical protein n=1 Tax=Burkholderia sp. BE12 TaxID=2082394 RepID=UPI001319FEBD|nr:hypothetical protein [Burkholderia sp. BE12]